MLRSEKPVRVGVIVTQWKDTNMRIMIDVNLRRSSEFGSHLWIFKICAVQGFGARGEDGLQRKGALEVATRMNSNDAERRLRYG